MVILWPDLTKKRKKRAETIRKIRPISMAGRVAIFIGEIKETTPKTRVDVIITPPIKSPRINQSWLFLAA